MSTRRAVRLKPGEIQARRVDNAAPHSSHSPGWPHLSHQGNCLCTGGCCLGRDGCRCAACSHQGHPRTAP
jgi:hypothetical protein